LKATFVSRAGSFQALSTVDYWLESTALAEAEIMMISEKCVNLHSSQFAKEILRNVAFNDYPKLYFSLEFFYYNQRCC
jgi:hypothetical protein